MLQALRGCIKGAGAKMGTKIRKDITQTLEGLLSCSEDTTRTTAAACLGTLCAFMTDDELSLILNLHFLGEKPLPPTHTYALIQYICIIIYLNLLYFQVCVCVF